MNNYLESERIAFELLTKYGIAELTEIHPDYEGNDRYRFTEPARRFLAGRLTHSWRHAENVFWSLRVAVAHFTADKGASAAEINLMSTAIAA